MLLLAAETGADSGALWWLLIGFIVAILALVYALNRQLTALTTRVAPSTEPPQRVSPPVTLHPRTCRNCRHFDLEEGQAALDSNRAFSAARQHVTPAKMLNRPALTKDGAIDDTVPASMTIPMKARWTDFGACMVDHEVRYQDDGCEKFEPKVQA